MAIESFSTESSADGEFAPAWIVEVDDEDRSLARSRDDATVHWVFLGIAAGILLLALLLRVQGQEHVVLPIVQTPLPGLCTFKQLAGLDCPGCGLTRCFISMAHGDLPAAWRFHPTGVFLFAFAVAQIPYRLTQVWRLRRGAGEMRFAAWSYYWPMLLVIALIVQWVVRVCW